MKLHKAIRKLQTGKNKIIDPRRDGDDDTAITLSSDGFLVHFVGGGSYPFEQHEFSYTGWKVVPRLRYK